MKPLRFRSLCCVRNSVQSYLVLRSGLSTLFFVLSLSLPSVHSRADSPNPSDPEQCRKRFSDGRNTIYTSSENHTLKLDFDPDQNCKKNAGNEVLSHNASAIESAPELKGSKKEFSSTEKNVDALKTIGACRLAYEGIREIFDFQLKQRESYCEKMYEAFQEAKSCGAGVPEKKCQKEWEAYAKSHRRFAEEINLYRRKTRTYLQSLEKATSRAKDKYEEDLRRIEQTFSRRSVQINRADLEAAAPDSVPDVLPANGNLATQGSNSLKDYFELLRGNDFHSPATRYAPMDKAANRGDLIVEQWKALQKLKAFREALLNSLDDQQDIATNAARWVTTQLNAVDRNGNAGGILGSVPEITNSTQLATQLLNGRQNSPGAAAPPVISGASHAPLAEIAAVGAIGAMAARSLSAASQAGSAGTSPDPAAATTNNTHPANPETTKFFPQDSGKTEREKDHSENPIAKLEGKADAHKSDAESPSPGQPLGAMDGSSRTPSGKRNRSNPFNNTPSSGENSGTGVVGGDGFGSSFSTNLDPKPAPKNNASNPTTEVANLLGQMKNLFNFDEQGPGAAFAGPSGSPGPGATSADPASPNSPGPPSDSNPMAESEPLPEGSSELAQNSAEVPMKENPQTQSLFGKIEVNLFQRVRSRHHRCMERGLVLYELKERVE